MVKQIHWKDVRASLVKLWVEEHLDDLISILEEDYHDTQIHLAGVSAKKLKDVMDVNELFISFDFADDDELWNWYVEESYGGDSGQAYRDLLETHIEDFPW